MVLLSAPNRTKLELKHKKMALIGAGAIAPNRTKLELKHMFTNGFYRCQNSQSHQAGIETTTGRTSWQKMATPNRTKLELKQGREQKTALF